MAGSMSDGLSSLKGANLGFKMTTGEVRAYDPRNAIYRIKIDPDGTIKEARALSTGGVSRPYSDNSKIVAVRCGVAGWFILAEYTGPQPNYDTAQNRFNIKTIRDEQAAFGAFGATDYRFVGRDPNFRKIDADGQIEPARFQGAVTISNHTERHNQASNITIQDFGDILIEASKAARIWIQRNTNRLFQKCRSFQIEAAGFNFKTIAPMTAVEGSEDEVNKVTVTTTICPDATKVEDADRSYEFVSGYQKTFVGTLLKLGKLGKLLSFKADETNSRITTTLGSEKSTGIVFDESSDTIKITRNDQTVELTPNAVSLVHKGQFIRLTDAGLEINAKAITIRSDEQTTVASTGPVTLNGSVVNIN